GQPPSWADSIITTGLDGADEVFRRDNVKKRGPQGIVARTNSLPIDSQSRITEGITSGQFLPSIFEKTSNNCDASPPKLACRALIFSTTAEQYSGLLASTFSNTSH